MEKASPRAWGVSLIGGLGLHEGCKRVQKVAKVVFCVWNNPTSGKGNGCLFVCWFVWLFVRNNRFMEREAVLVLVCLFIGLFVFGKGWRMEEGPHSPRTITLSELLKSP